MNRPIGIRCTMAVVLSCAGAAMARAQDSYAEERAATENLQAR